MEVRIRRAVKVPGYVIQQMAESLRDAGFTVTNVDEDLASDLRGALVNLDDDGKDDLLVQGDPGANVTGFWLFRNTGRKWEVVLYTVALNLYIGKNRTNGFHDVSVEAASAVMAFGATYKFDGARYKPGGCWERDLGVGKNGEWGELRHIECTGDVKPYR